MNRFLDNVRVRWRKWLIGSLLVGMIGLAYLPALRGGFNWDDDSNVTNNLTLRDLTGLRRIWLEPGATQQYYPVTHSSFWVEYHLWGLRPLGYHLVNLLLHAANAFLLWRVLRRLSVPGAGLAAAVFALHPVHVESVAWITERKNVLSGFFYLASMLSYLRAYGIHEKESPKVAGQTAPRAATQTPPVHWAWYLVAVGLFILALLSKTVTCTLPAAVLLLLWWKHDRLTWRDALLTVPLFALGLSLAYVTAWVEQHFVGAQGGEWTLSVAERLLVAGRAVWFYAGKLLWPNPLCFIYERWALSSVSWWQWLFPIGVIVVILALWALRRRVGTGALVGMLYFCGTLAPALGFVNVYFFRYSFVSDHFQYLASIGLITVIVGYGANWLRGKGSFARKIGVSAAGALLMILGLQVWLQGHVYADRMTLWRDTVTKNPLSWMAHNNLGNQLLSRGKPVEAVSHFREALRLNPDYLEARINLGVALTVQGDYVEAIRQYRETLRLAPENEGALNDLAWILATNPNPTLRNGISAVRLAERACALTAHEDAAMLDTLAAAYAEAGRFAEAIKTAEHAATLARTRSNPKLTAEIEAKLPLYRAGLAYREMNRTTSK